jgi:hypothetical protein
MTVIRGDHKRGPAMRGYLIYVHTPKQPLDYPDLTIAAAKSNRDHPRGRSRLTSGATKSSSTATSERFRGMQASSFPRVIPEIEIWRATNLMFTRYGD